MATGRDRRQGDRRQGDRHAEPGRGKLFWAGAGALVLGLGIAGFVLGGDPVTKPVPIEDVGSSGIDGLLKEIRAQWNPRVRASFLYEASKGGNKGCQRA